MQQQFVAGLRGLGGLAGIALPAAACSSGSPSARSGASPSADLSVALGNLVQRLHARGERGVYLSHAPASPNPGSTSSRQSRRRPKRAGCSCHREAAV